MKASATWQAPGRVNLIGEHTDYNGGFALPFAIDRACVATVEPSPSCDLEITSAQEREKVTLRRDELSPGLGLWADYVSGVVWAIEQLGFDVAPLRIHVDSTVPTGAGLSSSAALICAVATAVDDILGLRLSPDELLAVTRRAENDFVGASTGGLDQLAALRSEKGHALFCDMRSFEIAQVPLALDSEGLTVLVVDTGSAHSHAGGLYAARRETCERAAQVLGVNALRDIDPEDLTGALRRLPDEELRRCTRHVVTENQRVLGTVELLRRGTVEAIGPFLSQSHESLRDDFRVSTAELDLAVELLLDCGAYGARMTGGGFGGCAIGLLSASAVDDVAEKLPNSFRRHHLSSPATFEVRPEGPARPVEN